MNDYLNDSNLEAIAEFTGKMNRKKSETGLARSCSSQN